MSKTTDVKQLKEEWQELEQEGREIKKQVRAIVDKIKQHQTMQKILRIRD